MLVRRKNITWYCQEFDNEESEDSDEEEKWRPKQKETKYHFETYRKGVYCQNCYNERHFTKECKLLKIFIRFVKKMIIILINVPTKHWMEDTLPGKLFQCMWYKQKHWLYKNINNYKSIIHQIINLEINNIIQDQMVIIY
jgi:hypothetical protein